MFLTIVNTILILLIIIVLIINTYFDVVFRDKFNKLHNRNMSEYIKLQSEITENDKTINKKLNDAVSTYSTTMNNFRDTTGLLLKKNENAVKELQTEYERMKLVIKNISVSDLKEFENLHPDIKKFYKDYLLTVVIPASVNKFNEYIQTNYNVPLIDNNPELFWGYVAEFTETLKKTIEEAKV
jgi:hypothetical protein